ncbi:hypothetical protein IU440_28860 [Nocardia cyriacigeorgica]|uniref:hypothetical protein n=1 Tax=Nocardia cyriacigeorgica TaxID=135487 RepID=UPI001893A81C|nr:hypothetical protein [Nocardia cyriacigeorgica]MBF6428690.1 hypothetical protein [Nocardia cyriacigeorgica]
MTTPHLPSPPSGAFVLGSAYGQDITEESAKAVMKGAPVGSFTNAENELQLQVKDPIDNAYTVAVAAQGAADQAVTEAQAAANSAATSEATAAALYQAATYWEVEFVVASAAVLLGVNELLIGPVQNVPLGLVRKITDIHVALLSQPNGMEFQLKKWNPDGTSNSVISTYQLTANQIRANWQIGVDGYEVVNRERLYINVTSVTGSDAPVAFQVLLFGVLYDPALQPPE